jgi:hypothetical protein
MNITQRLYVEIVPLEGPRPPQPHPIRDAHFDPALIYKVLGMYNASETSECYFVLANPQRQIWFISQRHTRAWALIDSDELFLLKHRYPISTVAPDRLNDANASTVQQAFGRYGSSRLQK